MKNIIERLISFVDNGGRLQDNEEPKFGEPFYGSYMKQFLPIHYKPGDRVRIVEKIRYYNHESKIYEGLIIALDYNVQLLVSGKKVHKDKRNKKEISYTNIKSIEMIEPGNGDFDLSVVDPDLWKWKNERDKDDSDIWSKKTDGRRKRRAIDQEKFHKVYPDVNFDNSHVIEINDGCHLYWPFNYNSISAEIFMVKKGNIITSIPCKTGTPFPNKNSFCAYNCKYKDEYPDLYLYLPDEGSVYEDINIVCVWTINTTVSGENTSLKVVNVHHIDKISPIEDEHNMIFVDMHIYPLLGYGDDLFTDLHHSSLLIGMMNRDIYTILNLKEDYVDIIKMPEELTKEELEKFSFMSNMAIHNFNLQEVVRSIACDQNNEVFPMVEVFCDIDKEPEYYYSSSWRNCRKEYSFKMLEKIPQQK